MRTRSLREERILGRAWVNMVDTLTDEQAIELKGLLRKFHMEACFQKGKVPLWDSTVELLPVLFDKLGE